jgi:hypothetical protein
MNLLRMDEWMDETSPPTTLKFNECMDENRPFIHPC